MAVTLKRPATLYPQQAEFFGRLMQITSKAHLTHLRQFTKSGWEHKALNTVYEDVVDLVDGIIESWQGIYGLIDIVVPVSTAEPDAISFIEGLYSYVQANRHIFTESWIQNEIDNVCMLLAQTLYRLKYVQ